MSEQAFVNPVLSEIQRMRSGLERLEKWAREVELAAAEGRAVPIQLHPCRPTWISILNQVCNEWQIESVEHLQHHSNRRYAVEPRQVAAYISSKLLDMSLQQIGRMLGAFHHTTVMHGIRKIEQKMKDEPEFKQRVESVMERLK